jgi:hypothetical protein
LVSDRLPNLPEEGFDSPGLRMRLPSTLIDHYSTGLGQPPHGQADSSEPVSFEEIKQEVIARHSFPLLFNLAEELEVTMDPHRGCLRPNFIE